MRDQSFIFCLVHLCFRVSGKRSKSKSLAYIT